MFKLTVVAGPNRGTTYMIHDGENAIGRQSGNAIVLPGSRVSKRHCVLVVDNTQISLKDEGSANGTFVNGVMAKERRIRPGDRISVGEFVLELSVPPKGPPKSAPALPGLADVLQFPSTSPQSPNSPNSGAPAGYVAGASSSSSETAQPAAPTDLKGKALFLFENFVMPFFYGLISKNEWNSVFFGVIAVFTLISVPVSVTPLMDANTESIIAEARIRARFIARQIAETNAPILAAKAENRVDVGLAARSDGVRVAVIVEPDGRIIAPENKAGQYLVSGVESIKAREMIEKYRTGKVKTGWTGALGDTTVIGIEPIEIYNPATARNVIVAISVVSLDISRAVLTSGDIGTIYSKTFILTGILALLMGMVLYKITLRPFHQLNEDLDKVLKGDMSQVTREYKFGEMKSLWDMINVALQRLPKDSGGSGGGAESGAPSLEDYVEPFKSLGAAGNLGLAIFGPDRRIVFLNELFEDMSGIRGGDAIGQEISEVARDQSTGQIFNELFDRASTGGQGAIEEVELTAGSVFKVHVAAMGKSGESAKCYVVTAVRSG